MRDAGVKIGCIPFAENKKFISVDEFDFPFNDEYHLLPFVHKKFLNMVARGDFYNEWLRGIYGEVIWFSIFEIRPWKTQSGKLTFLRSNAFLSGIAESFLQSFC